MIFTAWDVCAAVKKTARSGYDHIHQAIESEFIGALTEELSRGPFVAQEKTEGIVRERYERFGFRDHVQGFPHLEILRASMQEKIRTASSVFQQLALWTANDVAVQKYGPDSFIDPHRDHSPNLIVVAIANISGAGVIAMHGNMRNGPALDSLYLKPGDIYFLRAPGLVDMYEDDRPMHSVGGCIGDGYRISAAIRYNVKGGINGHDFH